VDACWASSCDPTTADALVFEAAGTFTFDTCVDLTLVNVTVSGSTVIFNTTIDMCLNNLKISGGEVKVYNADNTTNPDFCLTAKATPLVISGGSLMLAEHTELYADDLDITGGAIDVTDAKFYSYASGAQAIMGGVFTLNAGGILDVYNYLTLGGGVVIGGPGCNSDAFYVHGYSITVAGAATINCATSQTFATSHDGLLTVGGNVESLGSDDVTFNAGLTVTADGVFTFNGPVYLGGATCVFGTFDASTLDVWTVYSAESASVLALAGIFEAGALTIANQTILAIATGTATASSLNLMAEAAYAVDISSSEPAHLVVSGAATLSGAIVIHVESTYTPASLQSFVVLNYTSHTQAFADFSVYNGDSETASTGDYTNTVNAKYVSVQRNYITPATTAGTTGSSSGTTTGTTTSAAGATVPTLAAIFLAALVAMLI